MEWQVILAIVIVIPIILIPVLFVWYINIGGLYGAFKEARVRKAARAREEEKMAEAKQPVITDR